MRALRIMALLIGVFLMMQGILGLVAPDVFLSATRFIQTPPLMYLAAVLRVVIGVVLVCAAPGSRAPMFLRVFGFLVIIGGLLTPFLGVWTAQHILGWLVGRGIGSRARIRGSFPGARPRHPRCGCSRTPRLC